MQIIHSLYSQREW